MNIYCVIFMCTFGANNTETEVSLNNSLIATGSPLYNLDDRRALPVNVAKTILPEKGEAVPQMRDIVMELPNLHHSQNNVAQPSMTSNTARLPTHSTAPSPTLTLSDILLPPSAQLRSQLD